MESLSYKTLSGFGKDEFVVNRSRFIGHARPAETEAAALGFLRETRENYKDANHNCYAYIVGTNAGIMRYNDDGEPQGTAGLPILGVIRQQNLVNLCVVVTRYFGGILLGAGGLARAYTEGCAVAIRAAGIAVMRKTRRGILELPYPLWDRFRFFIENSPYIMEDITYLDSVVVTLLSREEDAELCEAEVARVTDGKVALLWMDEEYLPWKEAET